jgi:hypothetical protein
MVTPGSIPKLSAGTLRGELGASQDQELFYLPGEPVNRYRMASA